MPGRLQLLQASPPPTPGGKGGSPSHRPWPTAVPTALPTRASSHLLGTPVCQCLCPLVVIPETLLLSRMIMVPISQTGKPRLKEFE